MFVFFSQAHPRWNSRYWKIWPSTKLTKRAIANGRNLDSAHILYNPLLEGGQRRDDVAGDNFIDIMHPKHVDEDGNILGAKFTKDNEEASMNRINFFFFFS